MVNRHIAGVFEVDVGGQVDTGWERIPLPNPTFDG